MASDAEVDLVINATRALADAERELDRVVRQAQNTVDPVQLRASLDRQATLRDLSTGLRRTIADAEARARTINIPARVDVDENSLRRFDRDLSGVRRTALTAVQGIAALSAGTVALGSAVGGALPLVAGLVTAMESIAPAAAVGTTGLLALVVAGGTVALAMQGVEDAISSAFDPDVKPEDLAKQMERLAPNARSFVRELVKMRGQFRGLQQAVQNQFFENFDAVARQLGRTVLPQVSTALRRTSGSFNEMIRRAAAAAVDLSESGVLGQALSGVTQSFRNLRDVPAQAVTGFGALAAAAAPALDRITAKVAEVSQRLSEQLVNRFRSGELTKAIDEAFANLASLGRSVGNVLGGLRNIFRGLSADGQGLFERLEEITGAFRRITASSAFQTVLGELATTAQTLGRNLLTILGPAVEGVAALFEALAPSVRRVLDVLGPSIGRALSDLKPLFTGVGEAVGGLLEAAAPLVDLAVQLIGLIGGALGPIFSTLGDIFRSLAPVLRQVADNFLAIARPILEQLGPAFEKVFPKFSEAAERIFPKVAETLAKLEPGFQKLGEAFAKIVPLLAEINALIVENLIAAFEELAPILQPIIDNLIEFASGALQLIAFVLETFVVPALEIVIDLLNGDWNAAVQKAIKIGQDFDRFVSAAFESLKARAINAILTLGTNIVNSFNGAVLRLKASADRNLGEVVTFFRNLPGRITSALGNLGSLLFNAGSAIVQGMIAGVQAKAGALFARLAEIARRAKDTVTSILGIASPSKEFAKIGDFMIQGLQVGLARSAEGLRSDLEGLALSLPQAATPAPLGAGVLTAPAPIVNVYVGNERLGGFVDSRIQTNNRDRDRRISQGGGRR